MLHLKKIVKPEILEVEIRELPDNEKSWYGAIDKNSKYFIVRVKNYSWFPTENFMGITKGKFNPFHKDSIVEIGSGNLGSASVLVKESNLNKLKVKMRKLNYKINVNLIS